MVDLNQDIGALLRELLMKIKIFRSQGGGKGINRGRFASGIIFIIPVVGALSMPAYKFVSNIGLPEEYQSNIMLRELKASEHAALKASLEEQTLKLNIDGGLFEEQREIEQFFSFIADEVVAHRLTTQMFSQSEVVEPTIEEGAEQPFYVVNPGAQLDLSGDYGSIMAFLTAIHDLDKEIEFGELTLERSKASQDDPNVTTSEELDLSLSLQVFRLIGVSL